MCYMYTVYSGMQEWVLQIPSIPILVLFVFHPRINFLLLVVNRGCSSCMHGTSLIVLCGCRGSRCIGSWEGLVVTCIEVGGAACGLGGRWDCLRFMRNGRT